MAKIFNYIAGTLVGLGIGLGSYAACENNADKTLVHVKQVHRSDLYAHGFEDDDHSDVIKSQNAILRYFREHEGKEHVFVEGNFSYKQRLARLEAQVAHYQGLVDEGLDQYRQQLDDTRAVLDDYLMQLETGEITCPKVFATEVLEYNDEIYVHRAETDEQNRRRCDEVRNSNGVLGIENERAEDYVVDLVEALDEPVSYVVFGAMHSFKDNTQDRDISLKEVFP